MEIFIALVVIWLIFSRKARKQNKQLAKLEAKRQQEIAYQQADYDDYMNSLPTLVGDETYKIMLTGADQYGETLSLYADWMVKNHPDTKEIWVIVDRDLDHQFDRNAIRVEAGQATFGHVPRLIANHFGKLVDKHGPVRASARLKLDPFGSKHTIWLDASFPLEVTEASS